MPYKIFNFVPLLNKNPNLAGHDIGNYTYGKPLIIAHADPVKLKIGKFCSIGDGVVILLGGEHNTNLVTTYPFCHYFNFADSHKHTYSRIKGDIVIGNDVWIGQEAFILSGVTIGDGAVIGARSVVTKDVKPYSIVAGSPARHIKYRVDEDLIEGLERIAWWNWPIEKIAEAMPLMLSTDLRAFVEKYLEQV